jgi:GntR family transcriptional regulator
MPNWLDVNPHSGIPLYVQLVEQIKHALEVGVLQPGDQLPTVRQLAGALTIAPNTIVKAYDELERLGLIESRQGAGTRVAANLDGLLRQQRVAALFERLHVVVRDAANLGISLAELRARCEAEMRQFYQEAQGEQGDVCR